MALFRVKLDEHLGHSHRDLLHAAGYDAQTVRDEGLGGSDDGSLWSHVCAEGRFFVTLDLGFSDIRRMPPGSHPGVLLLRPRSSSALAVTEVLARVLQEQSLESLAGCLAVADTHVTRIRRPESEAPR